MGLDTTVWVSIINKDTGEFSLPVLYGDDYLPISIRWDMCPVNSGLNGEGLYSLFSDNNELESIDKILYENVSDKLCRNIALTVDLEDNEFQEYSDVFFKVSEKGHNPRNEWVSAITLMNLTFLYKDNEEEFNWISKYAIKLVEEFGTQDILIFIGGDQWD